MKSGTLSMSMFIFSMVAAVLAVLDSGSIGVWLSATTWLIISVVLGVWAIYTKE